jgi:hypothetical protein
LCDTSHVLGELCKGPSSLLTEPCAYRHHLFEGSGQVSQSDAGLRFFGLAACFLTLDWWLASESLRELIRDSAADKKLVPTSHQIKQPLGAIDYLLSRSGFADSVVG